MPAAEKGWSHGQIALLVLRLACLGLAPADGGLGAHLFHDLCRMLAGRTALLEDYPD